MYVCLGIPASVKAENDKELESVSRQFKARKLQLKKGQREKLDSIVRRMFESHQENTGALMSKLREANEFIEGKHEDVDFPFGSENSSSIDTRYAASQARTFVASFNRSVFSSPNLLIADARPDMKKGAEITSIESAMNWTLSAETNAIQALKATPLANFRDGTSFVYGEWVRKIERGVDFKVYKTMEEFVADYPSADDAEVSQSQYDEVLEHLAEPESEVHVEYELDFVSKNKPEYTQFSLAKLVWAPLSAKNLDDMDLYGYRFTQGGTEFEVLVKKGYYDEEPSESVRKKGKSHGNRSTWDSSRDEIEGINSSDSDSTSYEMAKLVVCADLDGDSIPERYKVIWSIDANRCIRIERYDLRRNVPCIVPFRLIRKGERFLGDSILMGGMDLYKEVNALHRHRSNVRRITDSVTLMAPLSIKQDVDLGAEYSEFRPGMTLWVPDNYMDPAKGIRQFVVQGTSRTSESIDEEQYIVRYLDGLVGITQGQSGRETAVDPNAPGNKTAMLLMRADMRVEDYIDEWRESIPAFAELHRALYIQNSSSGISYMQKTGKEMSSSTLDLSLLADRSLSFSLRAMRPGSDPATEMNKIAAIAAVAMQFGIAQIKPDMIIEFWNDYVLASRVSEPERYMITQTQGGGLAVGGQPKEGLTPDALFNMMQSLKASREGGMNANASGAA